MNESLTLADISRRTGFEIDRLRYVVDFGILPGWRHGRVELKTSHGRGVARTFTAFSAFGIASAVAMLDAGLRRKCVMDCLDLLCKSTAGRSKLMKTIPLYAAYTDKKISAFEVGDSLNLRIVADADNAGGLRANVWLQAQTGALVTDFHPLIVVSLDVQRLRSLLQKTDDK